MGNESEQERKNMSPSESEEDISMPMREGEEIKGGRSGSTGKAGKAGKAGG